MRNLSAKYLVLAIAWVCCFAPAALPAEVNYTEGFEGKENPVKFWTCGPHGKYKVNFAGPTTERALSGKQSFKFDITFIGEGNYNYWSVRLPDMPTVPGMKLSGSIYVEQLPPNVTVGLGQSFFVPAYKIKNPKSEGRGMCGPMGTVSRRNVGKWIHMESDLNLAAESMSVGVLKEATPGVRLEKWMIYMVCRDAVNARLVFYVDDVSVKGSVPDNYEAITKMELADWADESKARSANLLGDFEKDLGGVRGELQRLLPTLPSRKVLGKLAGKPWEGYGKQLFQAIQKSAENLSKQTVPGRKELPRVQIPIADKPQEFCRDLRDTGLGPLRMAIANLRKLPRRKDPFLMFVRKNAISNYRVVPATTMVNGEISNKIDLFASPGEYEPATFFVVPSQDTEFTFELGELRSGNGVIPASALNLRVVKVWYQAGITVSQVNRRILTPELLLKDDNLVQVDHGKKINVVRNMDAPRDADKLLPVSVGKLQPRQFWLTVHVPEDASPGDYTGKILVRAQGLGERELKVGLRVLPIRLEEPFLEYSIYYRAQIGAETPAFVSSEWKTPAQMEAEFRNMKAHGITNPNVYQRFAQPHLDTYLDLRKRAGLKMSPLYYLGVGAGSAKNDQQIAERLALIRQVIAYARGKGINEVYFHGSDEARGDELKAQRRMWRAIHDVGGKIFVACSSGFFALVGDLLDRPVVARSSPADVPRVHAAGHKMHNYSNPSGAIEQPYTFRYHAGLWLVRSGMDGFQTYAYQHGEGTGKPMGHIWNDFDNKVYRVIAFAYPTVNGVVDTLQWEGVREGIDDVRYLTTLRTAIAAGKKSAKPLTMKLAQESKAWLRTVSIEGDLQDIRLQMAERIILLAEAMK